MSIERSRQEIEHSELFYGALIGSLLLDNEERTRFFDAFYYTASAPDIERRKITDYVVSCLSLEPDIPESNRPNRMKTLGQGLGCLTIEVTVSTKRHYVALRPKDLVETGSAAISQEWLHDYFGAELDGLNMADPLIYRYPRTSEEGIIPDPLTHTYLRAVYDEIVGA